MVRSFLERGIESVLWVEPYPTRLPRLIDFTTRTQRNVNTSQPLQSAIDVVPVKAFPFEPLPGGSLLNGYFSWRDVYDKLRGFCSTARCVLGIGKPSALSMWALDNLNYGHSFLDLMDDFPAFYSGLSRVSMARTMSRVINRVDRVICSCHPLWDMLGKSKDKSEVVLNGYDMISLPPNCALRDNDVIGYVGTIGRWFDWPLVAEIAASLPDVTVRLVGPEFVPRPARLPGNIQMVPQCTQQEAVQHVATFTVGLIPFVRSELTASVDPIKYYEYRGMGLPIWSTDFGEMHKRGPGDGVVHVAAGDNWNLLYEECKAFRMTERELIAFRDENDWGVRFRNLITTGVGGGD